MSILVLSYVFFWLCSVFNDLLFYCEGYWMCFSVYVSQLVFFIVLVLKFFNQELMLLVVFVLVVSIDCMQIVIIDFIVFCVFLMLMYYLQCEVFGLWFEFCYLFYSLVLIELLVGEVDLVFGFNIFDELVYFDFEEINWLWDEYVVISQVNWMVLILDVYFVVCYLVVILWNEWQGVLDCELE